MSLILSMALPEGRADVGVLESKDTGIDQTIAVMRSLVFDAAKRSDVVALARALDTPEAIERWMRERVVFQADPAGLELLQSPALMLKQIALRGRAFGDCDDNSMLGAALLRARAYVPVFVVVSKRPRVAGGRFQHVFYGYAMNPDGKLTRANVRPYDPQEGMTPGKWPGKFPRTRIYRAIWKGV